MKTQITTIAAAVAFAMSTAAFAQSVGSDSSIYQYGSDNTNDVTQWGTQKSRILQEGNGNSATVTQDDVVGYSTYAPGRNNSNIEQTANGNEAIVDQLGAYNVSGIYQTSSDNDANVTQDGKMNDSYVKQSWGNGNEAVVVQDGKFNDSVIEQQGSYNTASVDQEGYINDSWVDQSGYGNEANVDQSGSNNQSGIQQSGLFGGYNNLANVLVMILISKLLVPIIHITLLKLVTAITQIFTQLAMATQTQ